MSERNGALDISIREGIPDSEYWDAELGLIGRHPDQVVLRMGWRLHEQRQQIARLEAEIARLKEEPPTPEVERCKRFYRDSEICSSECAGHTCNKPLPCPDHPKEGR